MASVHKGFLIPGKTGKIILSTGNFNTNSIPIGSQAATVVAMGTFQATAPSEKSLALIRSPVAGGLGGVIPQGGISGEAIAVLGFIPGGGGG